MVKKRNPLRTVVFYVLVVSLVLFVFYPFAWMISVSFRYDTDAFKEGFFQKFTLDQYAQLLGFKESIRQELSEEEKQLLTLVKNMPEEQQKQVLAKIERDRKKEQFPFLRFFRNSLLLAGIAAFTSLVLAIFGAYSFSRIRYPGRTFLQRSILVVYLFGGAVLAVPLYQIFVGMGLTRTAFSSVVVLFIIYVLNTLPVSLYMLGNYFRTIPYSIEEAAIIDGCTRTQAILKIVIPLSMPALITVFIYSFMIAWNEYLFASIFIRPFPTAYTLPVGLNELFYSEHAVWSKMMAASVLTAVPVVVLFMLMEKYLTSGLTVGGVKE
ncbi:MAG TPA: carbohydrate ABC transporter permease [Thermotogota bacterium]|nr:carbohydrate ABC transporter permease [Thermotogota bacterium]HRW93288.1 carbohydrate ABC transporter permease [Thermotogota bacterium]